MRKLITTIMVFTIIGFSVSAFAGGPNVHHVVLFNLKEGVSPQQFEEMIIVGRALLSQIPGVLEVSFGKKALENRTIHIKDYDAAIYVRWENVETGEVYGPHVLHQTLLKLYAPLLSDMKVIDFYSD